VPTQQEKFESIAMPHLAALLRVARRLTPKPTCADDLVQETMLLAWRGFRQFQPGTNARESQMLQSQESFRPMLQERVEIREALDALPLEQRTVLLLAVVEGFTCQEIAGILEVPIGTVMSRLSRARQELRKSLAPMAKEAYR
jgi:RNA polymerase sigma-70 factor (ECF subfamily)